MVDHDIELGDVYQDTISGCTGVVTAIADHLTGCARIGLYPLGEKPSQTRPDQEFFFLSIATDCC